MLAKNSKRIFGASIIFLIIAIILAAWGFPKIVKNQIQANVQIENSSKMFEKWVKMPIPLVFKVYVFNVTNPDEVSQGSKPRLTEIGPFVYKEYREKTILGYGENDTVKYMLKKHFVFDQAATGTLTEDDEIVVINFSYMAAILTIADMMPSFVPMVNKALEQFFPNLTDAFMRVRARDLFFDGVFLNCVGDNSALGLVCGRIKADTPPTMRPADDADGFYFSMFSHMNRSESGPYEMVRGTQDVSELGHIVSYNGKKTMGVWKDEYCGMLNGSDSSVFPPIDEAKVPERLYIFEPDICRSMYASLVGKSSIFNISAYYYEIDNTVMAAKSANPNNRCYCKKNWSANHDGCLLMGLLNLMPCQGAPAVASLPHFYLASEELLEYFADGIAPNKEKHNTFVYIDPITGVVMKGVRRLQFNIELRNMPEVPQLQGVPTGLFPMLWLEEDVTEVSVFGKDFEKVTMYDYRYWINVTIDHDFGFIQIHAKTSHHEAEARPSNIRFSSSSDSVIKSMSSANEDNILTNIINAKGAEIDGPIQEELKQSHRLLSYVEVGRWLLVAIAVLATIASAAVVAKSSALCPSRNNAVSFILRPGSDVNKGLH